MVVVGVAGVALGSPGPSGYGWVLEAGAGEPGRGAAGWGGGARAEAEFRGLLEALRTLEERALEGARVQSHSQLLIGQMTGLFPRRVAGLEGLQGLLLDLARRLSVTFALVSPERNDLAQRLAFLAACGALEGGPEGASGGRLAEGRGLPVEPGFQAQVSAGGVLYRGDGVELEVCLISKGGGRIWALPKGRLEPGESPQEAARREVLEETGHKGRVERWLDRVEYRFYWRENRTRYLKTVDFFLMPLEALEAGPRDGEAEEVVWFPVHQAHARLTYLSERRILARAVGGLGG